MNIKRKICLIAAALLIIIAMILIGPMDVFTHGFFYEEIDCEQIARDDYLGTVDLADGAYEITFVPQKPHMNGFEIWLTNQPEDNTGDLYLSVLDKERGGV